MRDHAPPLAVCFLLALCMRPVESFTAAARPADEEEKAASSALEQSKPDLSWMENMERAAAHLTEENLKVGGMGCIVAGGILCLTKDIGTGFGWVVSGGMMTWSSRLIAKQRVTNGLATTAKRLALQNADLANDLSVGLPRSPGLARTPLSPCRHPQLAVSYLVPAVRR